MIFQCWSSIFFFDEYFFCWRLQCYANLKSYIFLFFRNSSVFHFDSWASKDSFRGQQIVGTVPFAIFLVPDKVFMICSVLKCSEHMCRLFKLFISARTKDDLFCYKIILTWKIEKVEGGLTFLNYFYARTWLNTSFLTHVRLSSFSSCAFKNRHPFP